MIEKSFLQKIAGKQQTTFGNILREYFQHLFLTSFYEKKGSENFLFKGGTALKMVFGSSRFSEDLDFSGIKNSKNFEDILTDVLVDFSKEDIKTNLQESKKTSGGHLAIIDFFLFQEKLEIKAEVSFREKRLKGETVVVTSELVPDYRIFLLEREKIVEGKLQALTSRYKPRDFWDLYFLLRKNLVKDISEQKLAKILKLLEELEERKMLDELGRLLPVSFKPILKDFKKMLKKELERFL